MQLRVVDSTCSWQLESPSGRCCLVQVRAPPLQTTRSVRSVRVRLELDLSRILSNAKQCRVCIVCSSRNSNYTHTVDSFTSYSRVALPGPSESVYRDPHSAFDSRLRPGPPLTPRHTTSRLRTAGTAFLSTLSQSRARSWAGPLQFPDSTALHRALCSLGARTGVLPRGVLTSCAVQVQYQYVVLGSWWGGVAFRFVREQSRTVEYKSAGPPAADAPTMSMIYVARPRRSPITNY